MTLPDPVEAEHSEDRPFWWKPACRCPEDERVFNLNFLDICS